MYLNYPKNDGRRVAIVDPPSKAWEAKLEEEPVYHSHDQKQQTLTFHGHSRAGNVTGPLIYGNYGSQADLKALSDSDINMNGSIILMRYGGNQADLALKVKAAESYGAVGALIYSDPAETGFKRGDTWPEGRWLPWDGVQRGAVSLMSRVIGDVLTPGWASTAGGQRTSKDNNPGLVNIPSLPLSWRDAQRLLQSLQGHGHRLSDQHPHWIGGVPDVEWWSGDAPSSPHVQLVNEQDEVERQPIYNIHGLIEGMEAPQAKIFVGNHRDSWCFGAGDPGSGTAVLLEVVNLFGQLRRLGWRPLRTIEFVSWDGEEYNLIGSTEYVEENAGALRQTGIAYLNVDVGVTGDRFRAAASPLLQRSLMHVLDRVTDPVRNVSLRQRWDEAGSQVEGLGGGSDFVAFQDIAGVASIDFGFEGEEGAFPYHSCYETFEWMARFGDQDFLYHKALAQVWALLILELADRPILPLDVNDYASAVGTYVTGLEEHAKSHGAPSKGNKDDLLPWNTDALKKASALFTAKAKEFQKWEDGWSASVFGRGGIEGNAVAMQRWGHNERLIGLEKDLLDVPQDQDGEEAQETKEGLQYGVSNISRCRSIFVGQIS